MPKKKAKGSIEKKSERKSQQKSKSTEKKSKEKKSNEKKTNDSTRVKTRAETMKEEEEINIHELDIDRDVHPLDENDTKNGSKFLAVAPPGSGKSRLIEWLLYRKKHIIPVGIFFNGTEQMNRSYEKFAPKSFIFDELDKTDLSPLDRYKERQLFAIQRLENVGVNPWCACVFDDCMSDIKFLKTPIVNDMYKNGRWWRQMHICASQYAIDFPANLRSTTDGTFVFKESKPKVREKIYTNYGSCLESQAEFDTLMDQMTEDHTALYFNNKTTKNTIDDSIFYVKADLNKIPDDWKFGCREYWEFHEERYNNEKKF
jgi:hypothetical protein